MYEFKIQIKNRRWKTADNRVLIILFSSKRMLKKRGFYFFLLLLLLVIASGCSKDDDKDVIEEEVYTEQHKLQGYNSDVNNVVDFIVDKTLFASQLSEGAEIVSINIAGSFNGWNKTSNDWKMNKDEKSEIWTLEKTKEQVSIPGNSGHPEFKFVVVTTETNGSSKTNWMQPPNDLIIGYKFRQKLDDCNTLVIFPGDNVEKIIADDTTALTLKLKIEDFDSEEQMSNFRMVKTGNIGEGKLFRAYHPFIASRGTDAELKDIEALKIATVQKFMKQYEIKSIINLSESKTALLKDENNQSYFTSNNIKYIASETYQTAIDTDNVLYYETSYNTVYYGSTGDDFAKLIKEVGDFVMTHEPPFLVHCRLGTDRTGVVTGFLEALMGASWGEIAEDYSKSNEQGFREFRNENLLKYSLEKLLGVSLYNDTKMEEGIKNYLKTNTNIQYTDEDIEKIKSKLINNK